jgi:hypothetical protein
MNRRDFSKLAASAVVAGTAAEAAPMIDPKVAGVYIGAQTYSFRDRPLDACIAAMKEIGLGYAELYSGHIEPKEPEALKAFRRNPPLDQMRAVRKKFDDAGIYLFALNYSFKKDWTDEELARGFDIARAMGVSYITASANVSVAKRLDPLAQKHRIVVAFHNHSNKSPDEIRAAGRFRRGAAWSIPISGDQPGYRALHGCRVRSRGFSGAASFPHHYAAYQGSEIEPGAEQAVRPRRYENQVGSAGPQDQALCDSREHRVRVRWRGHRGGNEEVLRLLQVCAAGMIPLTIN